MTWEVLFHIFWNINICKVSANLVHFDRVVRSENRVIARWNGERANHIISNIYTVVRDILKHVICKCLKKLWLDDHCEQNFQQTLYLFCTTGSFYCFQWTFFKLCRIFTYILNIYTWYYMTRYWDFKIVRLLIFWSMSYLTHWTPL